MTVIDLNLAGEVRPVDLRGVVIAGWAGRDRQAVEAHIAELEELGVAPPATTPVFYRVSAARLTCAPRIQVMGEDSSGEVECVLLRYEGALYVGVGSDHTDRKAETVGITLSKQLCEKPIGRDFWRFEDVRPHWDELRISSFAGDSDRRDLYQLGALSELLPPATLIEKLGHDLPEGYVMFCGTVPVIGGIRASESFGIRLEDPVLNRAIDHEYACDNLPVAA